MSEIHVSIKLLRRLTLRSTVDSKREKEKKHWFGRENDVRRIDWGAAVRLTMKLRSRLEKTSELYIRSRYMLFREIKSVSCITQLNQVKCFLNLRAFLVAWFIIARKTRPTTIAGRIEKKKKKRNPRPFSLARDHHRDAFRQRNTIVRFAEVDARRVWLPSLRSRKERETSSSCALDSRGAIIIYLFIGIVYLSCVFSTGRGREESRIRRSAGHSRPSHVVHAPQRPASPRFSFSL